MRLIFGIIFLSMLFFSHASAQYFEGGILAGLTASQMDGDMLGGYNKPGLTAGMWVGRTINAKWNYRAEFKYIMKGAASNNSTDQYTFYRKTLHYIELPFKVSYNFSGQLFAEAGISAAYLAYATINTGNGLWDATGPMKRYELNSLAGIAYHFNEKVSLNFIFSYSIFPVSHLPGNLTIWNTYAQYNNVLELSVYYRVK
ncbi:MAG: outer membrane beta-barrel protein [Bacteroidales bacterium]